MEARPTEPEPAEDPPGGNRASTSGVSDGTRGAAPSGPVSSGPASPRPARTSGARDIGPFLGVTTVRVHGGYEICRGRDEHGRRVTILTMGPSAAESTALRATFVEAYEWARATARGGAPEFVGADLTGATPWIASFDSVHPAGVRRLFDRLVSSIRPPAPGRHTGNLPRITDTGGIPRSGAAEPRRAPSGRSPAGGRPSADNVPTGQLPQVAGPPPGHGPSGPHSGHLPRITGQPPGYGPSGPHSGHLPRITEPAFDARGTAPHRPPTARPAGPPTGAFARPGPDVLIPPPPMAEYQGRAYTAAPRPIAPPRRSGMPALRTMGTGRALPVVLLVVGLIAVGLLALLVASYLLLFG